MNKAEIISYIEDHIKRSLQNDVAPVLKLYRKHFDRTREGIGFFSIPRMLFPEIDGLGSFLAGTTSNTSKHAVYYMREYLGRVNPRYREVSGFIYHVYRHGLMHQHVPKLVANKGGTLGWVISMSDPSVPMGGHLEKWGNTIQIDAVRLYEDVIDSIDIYIEDIQSDQDGDLQKKFNNAYQSMNTPEDKDVLLERKVEYLKQSDFSFK